MTSVIDRRAFLGGVGLALLSTPLTARAQPQGKVHRVGYLDPIGLSFGSPESLVRALRELGWIEKQNVLYEARWADRKPERFTDLAMELARLQVDVIVARGPEAALAAKRATGSIPIVFFAVADPVGAGLVTNLARPEGNVTGLTDAAEQTAAKQLELLKEVIPRLSRVDVLWVGSSRPDEPVRRHLQAAAQSLGIAVRFTAVPDRSRLDQVLAVLRRDPPGAVFAHADELEVGRLATLGDFVLKRRIPMASNAIYAVWNGGLMSYGRSVSAEPVRVAHYVDRILRGSKPAELPVEQPTVFDLVVNAGTAKVLGIKLPPALLLRATQVID